MKNKEQSKEQLINELTMLRQQVTELKASKAQLKRVEEALQVSEENLKGILSSLHETLIVMIDREGKSTSVTVPPDLEMRYGIRSAEAIGKMPEKLFSPEFGGKLTADIQHVFKTGEPLQNEYRVQLPGGEFWQEASLSAICGPSGEVSSVVAFIRDITERKRAQEVLKENEEKFKDFFENANDLIQSVNASGEFVYVNKKWLETLGYSKEELERLKLTDILREDQIPHCMEIFKKVCNGASFEKVEAVFLGKDGSEIIVEGNVNAKIRDGKFIATRGIFRDITKQKKTEAAYRTLVENSLQGLAILQDHKVIFLNSALAKMLGYTIEELISFSPEEMTTVVHSEDREFVWKRYSDRLEEKQVPPRYEFRMIRKDGTELWVEMFSSRIDYNGKPAIQAAFVDITERKQAEEKLRSVEQEKATILNNMTERVVYQDREMRVIWTNIVVGELEGMTSEELIGRHCYEIWQKRTRPCENCPVEKALKTGELHQGEMTTPDGRIWFVRGHPVKDSKGYIVGAVEITLDITERKKADNALRESEEKFRNLAEQSPNMIFINKKGRVVYVNKKCEELMGYSKEEFYSPDFDFLTLILPEFKDLIKSNFSRHLQGEECTPCEYRLVNKEGKIIEGILTSKLVQYEGEKAILGTVTDITERKKMEEELLKAKKLESIGILAGGIAHDFNNILTGILGNISVAKAKTKSEDEIFSTLVKAEKASLRAKDLTQQLLTFSKGGAPVKETTTIEELIEDSADFVLRGSNVRCEFSIPDELWPVEVDKGQINQVLNNLIINADQAMPDGGVIEVSVENISIEAEDILPLKMGRYVKITIKDQGIGIPKQHLPKIFDPYFTTKKKGDGLGLATSYSIIKNHKGHIQVESKLGGGSTLIIYLPASRKKIKKKKDSEGKPLTGKGRILVMDDEDVVREVVGDLLAILGYEVEFARDGDEAIELYKEAKESVCPFDAIIMDLTVPGGMGGKESIQKLLKIDPEVKAIVSSGYFNDPVMSDFKKYGFCGIVAKPFKIEELSQVLHQLLTEMSKTVS